MARAATAGELVYYRTPGKWSRLYAAVFSPSTIYTARINQTFTTYDSVLEITYDTGSGTLANVLPDMTLLVGSSAGAYDIGICRIRSTSGTKFYISETSDIAWADNLYLTVINDFTLWAKHVLLDTNGTPFMDGGIAYSNQHTNFDPVPIMGSHRVMKLTGATVSASWSGASSYALDSTITSYAWSAPGSSASSGMTTATPTITWNAAGWYAVYLTVTSATGKTFFGIRYVYIWNDANPPSKVIVNDASEDAEIGGWQMNLSLLDNVTITNIRERSLVIVFSEDFYGGTQQAIGPVLGSENVEFVGWISDETITWNPEQGIVNLQVQGAAYWFAQIPSYPDGVEFTSSTSNSWTNIKNLTVNKGLFHFLHWRTTATRIMDVFLTDDTKYTKEVSSLAGNLWEQIREMAFMQIYARPGVNAQGQLFIEVHPQLVPLASRSWPTVMTITTQDWAEEINFPRMTKPTVAMVTLSGVAVNSAGNGTPYFSMSPGHAYPHHGMLDVQDRLLVASQSQTNALAGLYRGWKNNAFPDIPIRMSADVKLIDCFPRQKCYISITANDTPRGITYAGNIIPKRIVLEYDAETGHLARTVVFEAETFQDISVKHTVPGEVDRSTPPIPSLPPLPDVPPFPGSGGGGTVGAKSVIVHDSNKGFLYTTDFDTASPHWFQMNAGLTAGQYQNATYLEVCPNGAIYCAFNLYGLDYIARAPSLGSPWVIIEDWASITAKYTGTPSYGLCGIAVNRLLPESFAYILGGRGNHDLYIGAAGSYSTGAHFPGIMNTGAVLSYGFGKWRVTAHNFVFSPIYYLVSADGGSITSQGAMAPIFALEPMPQVTAGTTPLGWLKAGNSLIHFENNFSDMTPDQTDMGGAFSLPGCSADATGQFLMGKAVYLNGRGKSSDYGYSWAGLPNLPYGFYNFLCEGNASWWIAASSIVRETQDFGDTWFNKEGDITTIAPVPSINLLRTVP